MSKKNRTRKKSGFADTRAYPHKGHPANYRKKGQDEIEYITFTHHDIVEIDGKKYIAIPLDVNIDPKKKGTNEKSYAYPKVFVGKRSALGNERTDLRISEKDKEKVEKMFEELPREIVRYSRKKDKKK